MQITLKENKMKTPPWLSAMIIAIGLFFIAASSYAQQTPKLYVVVQHSNEGKIDAMNMARFDKEVVSQYTSNKDIVFVNYDLKNDNISAQTKADLDWYTVYQAVSDNKSQEGITIIDPASKQVLKQITLNANTADILKSINNNSFVATIPPGR